MEVNEVVEVVMDCAFDVHRGPGPGLFESAYKTCLGHELRRRGVRYHPERVVPLIWRQPEGRTEDDPASRRSPGGPPGRKEQGTSRPSRPSR